MFCKRCYRISTVLAPVFMWTGEDDSNTLRVDNYVFGKRGKNSDFKTIRIRVERLLEYHNLVWNGKTKKPSSKPVSALELANRLYYLACSALSFRSFALSSLSWLSCKISSTPVIELSAAVIFAASLVISSGVTESCSFLTLSAICCTLLVSPNSWFKKSIMS